MDRRPAGPESLDPEGILSGLRVPDRADLILETFGPKSQNPERNGSRGPKVQRVPSAKRVLIQTRFACSGMDREESESSVPSAEPSVSRVWIIVGSFRLLYQVSRVLNLRLRNQVNSFLVKPFCVFGFKGNPDSFSLKESQKIKMIENTYGFTLVSSTHGCSQ